MEGDPGFFFLSLLAGVEVGVDGVVGGSGGGGAGFLVFFLLFFFLPDGSAGCVGAEASGANGSSEVERQRPSKAVRKGSMMGYPGGQCRLGEKSGGKDCLLGEMVSGEVPSLIYHGDFWTTFFDLRVRRNIPIPFPLQEGITGESLARKTWTGKRRKPAWSQRERISPLGVGRLLLFELTNSFGREMKGISCKDSSKMDFSKIPHYLHGKGERGLFCLLGVEECRKGAGFEG